MHFVVNAITENAVSGNAAFGKAAPAFRTKMLAFTIAAISSGWSAASVYAQTPTTENHAATALPTVKVSASAVETATENTISYDREELEKIIPLDIKDVFKKDVAVSVGGSIAANQKVYVRGVEETAMAVSVDGARQNNKVFHHSATNLIDPSLLKAVRATAGISPADDGPGAVGGSLVYETVDVADVLAPGDNFGGFANAGYRTNSNLISTNGALMGRSDGFEFLGYLNRNVGDDYEDGNNNTVRFTEPALTSALAKAAYESAASGRFELSHELVNDDAARPYRVNIISVPGRPVPESRNYELTRSNTIFQYSKASGSGLWNPSLMIAGSETEVITREVPLNNPSVTTIYTGISSSNSAKLQNTFHSSFAVINAGIDYYDDSAEFLYDPDPKLEERAKNTGLFVQFRQNLTKFADLSYGLRYDDQTFTGTDGTKFDEQGGSANISGDLHLGQHISLNAGYAKVWGGVALGENFILNPDWDYSRAIVPVESDNYSVGIKSHYNGFLFEANVFETDIKNGRTPSWGGGPDIVADFVIDGFDVLIGFIGNRGEITLAYADIQSKKNGEITNSYDGNYFTAPLGKLFTLNAELSFYDSKVRLGLNGEKTLENKSVAQNGRVQDDYMVFNAYANYQLHENLALRVFVDNLNDTAYADRATYGQEFEGVVPFYEPGRSVGMNLRYQF